jgi:hypothetical protein
MVKWKTNEQMKNATNHVCDGNYLALFVNGELLTQAHDTTFSRGNIALTATSYEDEPTEIHFDTGPWRFCS